MIELSKHIEVLLLENDCVIVPGLGGFIAHKRQAAYSIQKGEFMPPLRTIGFNPQLIMNDGLLVQSYMQAFNTDFPDATRRIEKTVAEIKDQLYQQGQVTLHNVGTIYYNMNGGYAFEPTASSFFTPSLYGLESFTLPQLQTLPVSSPKPLVPEIQEAASKPKKHFSLRHFTRNVVAIAAAVCLFFVLSVPVENTYMDDANYASLGSISMFDAIRNQSVATSIQTTPKAAVAQKAVKKQKGEKRVRNNVNTLKPVAVKTEKIAAAPAAKTAVTKTAATKAEAKATQKPKPASAQPAASKKTAYIIVASLPTSDDAQRELKNSSRKDTRIARCLNRTDASASHWIVMPLQVKLTRKCRRCAIRKNSRMPGYSLQNKYALLNRMKRVRCPKCDNFIQFDETKYGEGQSLVFICDNCKKQFSIRIGKSKLNAANRKEEVIDEKEGMQDFGNILAVENVFAYKQVLPLHEGDNLIGRRCKGNDIDIPIESNDPSLDRRHCYINVKKNKQGKIIYTLRDNDSITGTFLMNEILGPKDQIRIEDGAIITLGATTLILRAAEGQTEE